MPHDSGIGICKMLSSTIAFILKCGWLTDDDCLTVSDFFLEAIAMKKKKRRTINVN